MAHERQKKLVKRILEISKKNAGKKKKLLPPMGKLMLEVGFAPGYAKNPQDLKGTETWPELWGMFLPKGKVSFRHGELLDYAGIEHYVFPSTGRGRNKRDLSNAEIKAIVESVPGCRLIYIKPDAYAGKIAFFQAPDGKVRKDAVDMAYKVYGAYAAEKISIVDPLDELSNAELAALEKELISKIKSRK
jgi:hypothetical protein